MHAVFGLQQLHRKMGWGWGVTRQGSRVGECDCQREMKDRISPTVNLKSNRESA